MPDSRLAPSTYHGEHLKRAWELIGQALDEIAAHQQKVQAEIRPEAKHAVDKLIGLLHGPADASR